jgi:UDP-N-acetylmuramoylalanine--D-glutamate ligase
VLEGLGAQGASDDTRLAATAARFPGLPSRCHSIGRVDSVEFVDDSLSTNVLPTRAALAAFVGRPVALLVGGHDRGIDYSPLGRALAERREPTLVVTMPDNGPRIGAAVRAASGGTGPLHVLDADDLAHAVSTAFEWAPAGGVVLLSPAAPSFGRFADYRDRATAFAQAAARCGVLVGDPKMTEKPQA